MKEPNYDSILEEKINYYGETKAAYQFAAEEYSRQCVEHELGKSEVGKVPGKFTEENIQKYFNRYSLYFDEEHKEYSINIKGFKLALNDLIKVSSPVKQTEEKPLSVQRIEEIIKLFINSR